MKSDNSLPAALSSLLTHRTILPSPPRVDAYGSRSLHLLSGRLAHSLIFQQGPQETVVKQSIRNCCSQSLPSELICGIMLVVGWVRKLTATTDDCISPLSLSNSLSSAQTPSCHVPPFHPPPLVPGLRSPAASLDVSQDHSDRNSVHDPAEHTCRGWGGVGQHVQPLARTLQHRHARQHNSQTLLNSGTVYDYDSAELRNTLSHVNFMVIVIILTPGSNTHLSYQLPAFMCPTIPATRQ
ncbi:hypothetical protein Bbelb_038720 [Branchiostoma belcheri]|nr:hypothetical protein Bbelb_038720 [Branchiostoma belcheri]